MANSLGTLASGIILARALELVVPSRPILSNISLDLSSESALKGETIKSRILGIPAVSDFPGNAVDKTDTDVPVTISAAKQILYTFTSAELTSTDRKLVDETASPIAIAIADHMVGQLASLYTIGNFPNETVETEANSDYGTLNKLRGVLTNRKVSRAGRFAVVNGAVYENLLNDPLCNRESKQNGADPIVDGELRGVAGFSSITEYPDLPTANNLTGFVGTKDSLVIATRLPKDPREVLPNANVPGAIGVITNKETGLSIMAVEWIDMKTLSVNVMVVWLYGVAKGNPNNGQRLVKASNA